MQPPERFTRDTKIIRTKYHLLPRPQNIKKRLRSSSVSSNSEESDLSDSPLPPPNKKQQKDTDNGITRRKEKKSFHKMRVPDDVKHLINRSVQLILVQSNVLKISKIKTLDIF